MMHIPAWDWSEPPWLVLEWNKSLCHRSASVDHIFPKVLSNRNIWGDLGEVSSQLCHRIRKSHCGDDTYQAHRSAAIKTGSESKAGQNNARSNTVTSPFKMFFTSSLLASLHEIDKKICSKRLCWYDTALCHSLFFVNITIGTIWDEGAFFFMRPHL